MKRWLAVAAIVWAAGAAHALVKKGSVVRITRNNGAVVLGTVLSETSSGFLIANGNQTELIPFTDMASVDDLTPRAEPVNAPPPPPSASVPAAERPPARRVDLEEEDRAPRDTTPARRPVQFGLGVSGGGAPSYYGLAWGVGADAGIALNLGSHFSLRFLGNYTFTSNGPYTTHVGLVIVSPSVWFGPYGLAAAVMAGLGDISRRGLGFAIGAFGSPIRFRFGIRVTHEIALDAGVVLITSDSNVSPFGRLSYTVYF